MKTSNKKGGERLLEKKKINSMINYCTCHMLGSVILTCNHELSFTFSLFTKLSVGTFRFFFPLNGSKEDGKPRWLFNDATAAGARNG